MKLTLKSAIAATALLLAAPVSAASLSTGFSGANGSSGNMFDIAVGSSNLTLTDLQVHIDETITTTVSFWYRLGSYAGNEYSSAGWTLLDSASLVGAGETNPTDWDIADLMLDANTTYGIYIHDDNSAIGYDNAASTGLVAAQNADLTIYSGIGRSLNADPFAAGNHGARTWEGTMTYTTTPAVPLPASGLLLVAGAGALAGLRRRK